MVFSCCDTGGSGAVDITAALMEPGTQGAQEEDQEPQAADLLTSMKEGPATTPVAADTIREAAACADNDAAPPAADLQAAAADPNSVAGSGIGAGSASYAASLQDAANDKDETAAGSGYADDDDTAGEPAIGAGGAGGGKPPGGVVNVMGGREAPSRHTEAEAAEAAAAAEAQAAAEAEEQAKADEASDLAHEEEDGDEDGDGNEGDGGEEGLAEILQDQMAEA